LLPSWARSALAVVGLPALYFYVRRVLAARKLARTGIGKGAPGFITAGTRRLAVTPELAARLRRGETVTPEEIEAAQKAAAAYADGGASSSSASATPDMPTETSRSTAAENEWLPDNLKNTTKRKPKGKRG
jgi:hypothetical protein